MKHQTFTFFLILLCSFFISQHSFAQCHPDDYTALRALYLSTDGDNWTNNTGWDVSSETPPAGCDVCGWYGVTCNENGRVSILTLSNNNLVGTLPEEIGQLTELVEIFLKENGLSGEIPEALYTIPTLENIILSSNSLTGNLSDNICQLSNLNEIRLSDNQLSGEIPACLGNFTNLLIINLQDNNFSGCYPNSWLTYCGNEQMHFDGNLCLRDWGEFCDTNGDCVGNTFGEHPDFASLMALYNATDGANWTNNANWGATCDVCTWYGITCNENGRVSVLTLPDNNLVGELPSEIGQLTGLVEIFLDENELSGTIPEDLYTIPTLENIILSNNSLMGNLSDNICQLSNLNEIRLSDNQLSGEIPACLGNFTNLLIINLQDNNFSGCYPNNWLTYCGNEQMHFDGNPCLRDWGEFCDTNGDCVGNTFGEHPDFASLMALYNATDGANWTNNANWGATCDVCTWYGITCNENGRVSVLTLPDNNLVGELPSEIGQLTGLVEIFLDENELSGTIPEDLYTIPTLENIILSNNSLTGNLSDNICQLSNLNEIRLSDNRLSSEIPACLGNFTNLLIINLQDNNFSGCYPNNWLTYCGNEQMHFDGNPCLRDWGEFCDTNGDCAASANTEHPDFAALMALYNATNGDDWTDNSNWGMDCDVCNWYGIICENNRVTNIRLNENNLSGMIPNELYNLTELKELSLYENHQLTGDLSASITQLTKLEHLDLGNNQMTGDLPNGLWNMTNLNFLALGVNGFTGAIPSDIGNLTNLWLLNLRTNNFRSIDLSAFENLINLEVLEFQENGLSGELPDIFVNMENLNNLRIHDNNFTGNLPPSLGDKSNLQYVLFQNNNFSDCYPANYQNLCNIEEIDFSNNSNLIEQDFSAFCSSGSGMLHPDYNALMALYNATDGANWTNNTNWGADCDVCNWDRVSCENGRVSGLHMRENNLIGMIPKELANLSNLKVLNLYINQLDGMIPKELANLTNLTTLNLGFNQLDGMIPKELANLINLEELWLDNNKLEGMIPIELGNLTNLTTLILSGNDLDGTIPEELANLTNLIYLSLEENQLDGMIPIELGNLTNLLTLNLRHNNLDGMIPIELGNLTNLNTLYLRANQLDGMIPKELGSLINLTFLSLSGNQLDEMIPKELGNLTNLTFLNLGNNELNGMIPKELANLTNLTTLNLHGNQLSEMIPKELGNLTNLEQLWLMQNQLSGMIPEELGNLINLTDFQLYENQLQGCIPSSFSVFCEENIAVNFSDNPNLDEQDFAAFCTTNSGSCIPIQWENLFTNVDTLWANGAPGPIHMNNDQVIPLIAATNCNNIENPIFTVGTEYGQGLVIGMANERPIIDDADGITTFDNQAFFENAFEFLNNGNGKQVGLVNYWAGSHNMTTIITTLEAKGFTFTNLSTPLTTAQLANLDVLFIGNDWRNEGTVNQEEVDIVENFVQNGGGAFLMGLGWSWPNDLADYPMNRFASPFGFEFIPNYFIEPVNVYNQWPYFVNMYPNIDLDAICPPYTCPANTDSLALMALYHATDGPNWGYDGGWGSYCKLSTWHGVSTNEAGRVIGINLPNNNLTGTLPAALGNLSELQNLRLYENNLTGSIPSTIGQLQNLATFDVGDNQLNGAIPAAFWNCTRMNFLSLGGNQLAGQIPTAIGDMPFLSYLNLSRNNFDEVIPAEIGTLSSLAVLELQENNFSGELPDMFSNLRQLSNFRIHDNNLTGNLPPSLGNIINLRTVLMQRNNFSGCFPFIYKNFCTNRDNLENTSFDFSNNPQLPNGGNFDQFCIDESGMCAATNPCERIELVFNPGANDVDFFFALEPFKDGHSNPRGSSFFTGSALNKDYTYYFELTEGFYRFHIGNFFNTGVHFFELRDIEAQTVFVNNTPLDLTGFYVSDYFPICGATVPEGSLIVTNLNDSGIGSLKGAIDYANELPGKDTIIVEVAGQVVPTCPEGVISEGNCLSFFSINDPVVIEGNGLTIAPASKGRLFTNRSDLTLKHLTIQDVDYDFNGGSIFNFRGDLILSRVLFTNNRSAGLGNVRNNFGLMTVEDCTFSNNEANEGGAIYNEGQLTIRNCTFVENSASRGSSIFLANNSGVDLINSIVANRKAPSAEDIYVTGFGFHQENSLVATCTGDDCPTFSSTDDPLLGPLQDNGGYTLTHELLSGSPAINSNSTSFSSPDQRGFVGDTERDMGAYETNGQQVACLENKYIGYDIAATTTTYAANNEILGDSRISTGATVSFVAGGSILLKPGFHATVSANFEAKIAACVLDQSLIEESAVTELTKTIIATSPNKQLNKEVLSSANVFIFPNPTTSTITIEVTRPITSQIILYNSFGQQLTVLPINQNSRRVDLSAYPTGVYWIALLDEERKERVVKKVVKQ